MNLMEEMSLQASPYDEFHKIIEEGIPLPELTEKDCDEIFIQNQLQMIELVCPQHGQSEIFKAMYEQASNLDDKIEVLNKVKNVIG